MHRIGNMPWPPPSTSLKIHFSLSSNCSTLYSLTPSISLIQIKYTKLLWCWLQFYIPFLLFCCWPKGMFFYSLCSLTNYSQHNKNLTYAFNVSSSFFYLAANWCEVRIKHIHAYCQLHNHLINDWILIQTCHVIY